MQGRTVDVEMDLGLRYGVLGEILGPALNAVCAVVLPPNNEAIDDDGVDIGVDARSQGIPSRTGLLGKPTLTRSETKSGSSLAKITISGRPDSLEEGAGAKANCGPVSLMNAPVQRINTPTPESRRRLVDIDDMELTVAPAKETIGAGERFQAESKTDSLDTREVLTRSWELRYGVPSSSEAAAAMLAASSSQGRSTSSAMPIPIPSTSRKVAVPEEEQWIRGLEALGSPPTVLPDYGGGGGGRLGRGKGPQGGSASSSSFPGPPSIKRESHAAADAGGGDMCHHCEEQPAGVHCAACNAARYCVECDTVLHRAARLRGHTRQRFESTVAQGDDEGGALLKGTGSFGGGHHALEVNRDEIRIQGKIGEGYFGVVYRGVWAGQTVAIKKLKHGTRRQQREFMNEVSVLAKLRHPNITAFFGVSTAPEWMIITEVLHGSLHKLLHGREAPRSLSRAVLHRIAQDVACGAAYIHGLSPPIIHRDINSSNVLLTGSISKLELIVAEGRNEPLAKLSDFGLSRSVERFMTQCTGNAYYLSPEVFRGGSYTEKADVYSFAILLWELYSRRYPFGSLNPRSAAFQQAENGLRPPTSGEGLDLPPEVIPIMERAWSCEPAARPSFREILSWFMELGHQGGTSWGSGSLMELGCGSPNSSSSHGAGASSSSGNMRGGKKSNLSAGSVEHEYLLTPLDWRRHVLHEKLVRRPGVSAIMGEGAFRGVEEGPLDNSLFGYELMGNYLENVPGVDRR